MSVNTELVVGRRYWVKFKCRDIGYGIEKGSGEYVYAGREPFADKLTFEEPIRYHFEGSPRTIYLFEDEIVYCESDD